MKELTIEEKAKAYDEATERAESIYNETAIPSATTKGICTYIFPELKESEDEKIRQFLIREIEGTSDEIMSYRNMNKKDVLTWLEKQGEHQKFVDSIQIGDKVTRNRDGVLVNLSQLNRVAKKDEKQGEQKPTIIIPRFRVGDEIKTTNEAPLTITKITDSGYWSEDLFICSFENSTKWELVEQNPAWSEEDEKMFNSALWHIKNSCGNQGKNSGEFEVYNWLKTIKDRYLPQPKQEWSEEDEEMYKEVLTDIIYAKNDLKVKECLGLSKRAMKAFNWFSKRYKSLKPQNWTKEDKERYISCLQRLGTGDPEQPETINSKWFKDHVYPQSQWRPSDEQMEALDFAANCIVPAEFCVKLKVLKELLEQLKNLRNE